MNIVSASVDESGTAQACFHAAGASLCRSSELYLLFACCGRKALFEIGDDVVDMLGADG